MKGLFAYNSRLRMTRLLAVPPKSIWFDSKISDGLHMLQDKLTQILPIDFSGLCISMTIPVVSANRTGLCGVFADTSEAKDLTSVLMCITGQCDRCKYLVRGTFLLPGC